MHIVNGDVSNADGKLVVTVTGSYVNSPRPGAGGRRCQTRDELLSGRRAYGVLTHPRQSLLSLWGCNCSRVMSSYQPTTLRNPLVTGLLGRVGCAWHDAAEGCAAARAALIPHKNLSHLTTV